MWGRTGSKARAICWTGRLSHFLHLCVSYPPPGPQPEASSHPNGSRAATVGFWCWGVSLEQTKLMCTEVLSAQHTCRESLWVSGLGMHKHVELPSRWKGLLHGFQTTREEGGEKTKTLAGETKNRKEEKNNTTSERKSQSKNWGENWQESD